MHIVENRSKQGKKIYHSVLLRESYRKDGKVRKRTIANLSSCKPEEIAAIKLALAHKDNLSELGSLDESVGLEEGLAVGAGLSLSLACDLTIAGKTAVMNMGYRRIGLTPDGGASFFLPRLVGMKRFNELYFLSRNIAMEEAQRIGLVNTVVDESQIEEKLRAIIDDIKALPVATTLKAKELVNLSLWQGLGTHLDKERRYVSEFASEAVFQERLGQLYKKK